MAVLEKDKPLSKRRLQVSGFRYLLLKREA
jgi:hypothetical protein